MQGMMAVVSRPPEYAKITFSFMIITPPYAVFDFSFKVCQDKDESIRSRLTEITIHPDAKECKCKFMQIINILFRKNGIYSENT